MRVRPFFWILLATSCLSALLFAIKWQAHVPAVMQVHLAQQAPASAGYTTVALHLADEQGLPIETAQVFSQATMTNMNMRTNQSSVRYMGQGELYHAAPFIYDGPLADYYPGTGRWIRYAEADLVDRCSVTKNEHDEGAGTSCWCDVCRPPFFLTRETSERIVTKESIKL